MTEAFALGRVSGSVPDRPSSPRSDGAQAIAPKEGAIPGRSFYHAADATR